MRITPVSFGKRIPVAVCQIKDLQTNTYFPAVISELDCKDYEDISDVKQAQGFYNFKGDIAYSMERKFNHQKYFESKYKNSFYILEDENNNILGMSQVENTETKTRIDFIESTTSKKCKYVGQSLLAAIGLENLKNNGSGIVIPIPVKKALAFYKNKCGFRDGANSSLQMNKFRMRKFIREVNKKSDIHSIDDNNNLNKTV